MANSVKYPYTVLLELIPNANIKQLRDLVTTIRDDKKFYTYKEYSDLLLLTSNRLVDITTEISEK
jgi:hypothetical protein